MIHEIGNRHFDNQYKNKRPKNGDTILLFRGTKKPEDGILVSYNKEANSIAYPKWEDVRESIGDKPCYYLFSIDDQDFYMMAEYYGVEDAPEIPGFSYESIRLFRMAEPMELSFAGMTAYHLYDWYRSSRFCGKCGHATIHDEKERMMRCPECGNMIFPKICPAVIVAVRDGEKLMMTHYAGREYKGRALLAGFCEIGESPEETVVREVKEEIGVDVTNVTYYKSQPWGFDSDLLLGYYCDVAGSSKVTLDEEELASASWVPRDEIEADGNLRSLTATMIEAFRCGEI